MNKTHEQRYFLLQQLGFRLGDFMLKVADESYFYFYIMMADLKDRARILLVCLHHLLLSRPAADT